ncbi:MAG: Na/Pi symporter [Candidatus Latescibacteria bacterium]|nr:Na/Pi symporter [Candidatus Latescibacterota bacterium]
MGIAFKSSRDTLKPLLDHATSNPFMGLVIGIVFTSIIQSSSTTTSIVVAMVAAGTLPLQNAIPMIMGANIGTTVTNTIVSFGYIGRRAEFERSFGASIVHDMFNICATCILFPLELYTGIILKTSIFLETVFEGVGGFKFISPLKIIVQPVSKTLAVFVSNHYIILILAFILLFVSLSNIIKNMKGIVMEKIEHVLNNYLFKNVLISLVFGMFFTTIVQSSSITTSLIIPLVGAGVLTIEQIFPYTLGANIGTTITAILAALTLGVSASMTVAFSHLIFNIFGILIVYPIKRVPIGLSKFIASFVAQSKTHFLIFVIIYVLLHIVPILFMVFS